MDRFFIFSGEESMPGKKLGHEMDCEVLAVFFAVETIGLERKLSESTHFRG